MGHLGRWLSAQVDDELDGVERDRVLNHIAGCEACRREANALRALKRRVTALGDSAADASITARLIELARSDQELTPRIPACQPRWWPARPGLRQGPRNIWLNWRIAVGSAGSALIALGVLAFLLGGSQSGVPVVKVTPAVDSYWTQHSYDTGQEPASGSLPVPSSPAGPASQPGAMNRSNPVGAGSAWAGAANRAASGPAWSGSAGSPKARAVSPRTRLARTRSAQPAGTVIPAQSAAGSARPVPLRRLDAP